MKGSYTVGEWQVEPTRNRISRPGDVRKIDARHMRMLDFLARHPGRQISIADLLEAVYRDRKASVDSLSIAVSHLREALGDTGTRPTYIKYAEGRGYTLIAKVKKTQATPVKSEDKRTRWLSLVGLLLLALPIILWMRSQDDTPPPLQLKTVSILPTLAEGEQDSQVLADLLTETYLRELGKLDAIQIVSLPESAASMSREELVKGLKVDALIEGKIKTQAKRYTFSTRITHLASNRILLDHYQEVDESLVGNAGQNLLSLVADTLLETADPQRRLIEGKTVPSDDLVKPDAYQHFIKGYALLNEGRFKEAMVAFDKTRQLDPEYAEAYLGLALAGTQSVANDPLARRKILPELEGFLKKALDLNPDLVEAYTALGTLQFLYTWDFTAAEFNLTKAIELNPEDAEARHWYALFCVAFARFDKATEQIKRVKELVPLNYNRLEVAWMYNMMGDYENAIAELQAFGTVSPNAPALHQALVRLFENMGNDETAFRHYLFNLKVIGYDEASLQQAASRFQQGGLPAFNRWLAVERFEQSDIGQYEQPLSIARYCAAMNEKKLAFDWLTKAVAVKQTQLLWLNVDPKYDILRGDPRFTAIIKEIGLDYHPRD